MLVENSGHVPPACSSLRSSGEGFYYTGSKELTTTPGFALQSWAGRDPATGREAKRLDLRFELHAPPLAVAFTLLALFRPEPFSIAHNISPTWGSFASQRSDAQVSKARPRPCSSSAYPNEYYQSLPKHS